MASPRSEIKTLLCVLALVIGPLNSLLASATTVSGQIQLLQVGGDPNFQDQRNYAFGMTVTTAGKFLFDVLAREQATDDLIGPAATQNLIDALLQVYDASGNRVSRIDDGPEFIPGGGPDGIVSDPADPFGLVDLGIGNYTVVVSSLLGSSSGLLAQSLINIDPRKVLGAGTDDFEFGFQVDPSTGLPIAGTSADVKVTVEALINPSTGISGEFAISAVPLPAAVWLFATAIIGLLGFGQRKKLSGDNA